MRNSLDETTNQLQQLGAEQQQSPQLHGSTGDGSKSVVEQVTEQVEAVRAELEARHQERVELAEVQFQKRADSMKVQLSKKLSEGREKFKQAIADEHEAALARLTEGHQKEVERLKAQHQQGIEVLTSQQDWTPTESQVKELVANNPTIKSILSRNIRTKLDQERASITARIEEEQEKLIAEKIDELQKRASKAREDAVQMEAKRHSVKLSMTENRARAALAKIEVVQKAAEETPQRPVGEVWAIAKDVKPAPVMPPQPQGGVQASVAPQASTFGQPTPVPGSFQIQPSLLGTNMPSSLPQPQTRPLSAQGSVQQRPFTNSSPNSAPKGQSLSSPTSNPNTSTNPQPVSQLQFASNRNQTGTNTQQTSPFLQSMPDLPAKPPQAQPSNHPNAGPAANRALMSGIPRGGVQAMRGARGGRGSQAQGQPNQFPQVQQTQNLDQSQFQTNNTRGTGIPRGSAIPQRGRGAQGRGVLQQAQTSSLSEVQNQAQRSPGSGRGAMNAAARQFIPQGNKRGREEGQDGSEIANGKRMKNDGS